MVKKPMNPLVWTGRECKTPSRNGMPKVADLRAQPSAGFKATKLHRLGLSAQLDSVCVQCTDLGRPAILGDAEITHFCC